jgi:hypothetical protein
MLCVVAFITPFTVTHAALISGERPLNTTATLQAKLLASNRSAGDGFGHGTEISDDGNTLLIVAYQIDTRINDAYIFTKNGGNWTELTRLVPENQSGTDGYGRGADLSGDGNTAIITAPGANGRTGAARIFVRNGTTWTQQGSLVPNTPEVNSGFGTSVAISYDGNTAIVGSQAETVFNGQDGVAYVFTRSGTTWTQQARLVSVANPKENSAFGNAVAISADGNTVLIGAYLYNPTGEFLGAQVGAAYIFTRTGGTWAEQAFLLGSNGTYLDAFGDGVQLSADGNTAVVTAPKYNPIDGEEEGIPGAGAFYTFTRNGSTWTEVSRVENVDLTNGVSLGFGLKISPDATQLIASDPGVRLPNDQAGKVYFYTRAGNTWNLQTSIANPEPFDPSIPEGNFGWDVAISADGSTGVVGAWSESTAPHLSQGAVFVYGLSGGVSVTPTPTTPPVATATATATATVTVTATPSGARRDTIGVYKGGQWWLRNQNSTGAPDIVTVFGNPADLPVVGDWNGDSVDTLGLYRVGEARFILSDSNTSPITSYNFVFGIPGDSPMSGRWDIQTVGNGVGVYRGSNGLLYLKRVKTNGFSDYAMLFGNPGDVGVAGDWNNDGFDSIGVYRNSTQYWFLTNTTFNGIPSSAIDFVYSTGGNRVVTGDWDGDGVTTPGHFTTLGGFVLHPTLNSSGFDNQFPFGPADALPVAGKWVLPAVPVLTGVIQPIGGNSVNGNSDSTD